MGIGNHVTRSTVGTGLLLLGAAVNRWTLAPLLPDGNMGAVGGMLLLLVFQVPVATVGALLVRTPGARSPSRYANSALLILSLAWSLLFVEALLRIPPSGRFRPHPRAFVGEFENRPSEHFRSDSLTGWRMIPNTAFRWRIDDHSNDYRSNSQGFRSPKDFSTVEAPRRVFLAGDSFTFGTGVEEEETFGALLERRLGQGTAVYNHAMPGFGLDQMWMSVRHHGLPLRPNLVVVAFIDEDLDRSLMAYREAEGFNKPTFELDDGQLRPQTRQDGPTLLGRALEQHSAILTVGRMAAREAGYRFRLGEWWLRNEAVFKAIIADCREASVPALFVRLPVKQWREFPNLRRLMADEQASLLDLANPAARPADEVHFKTDGHINAAGHAFVAEAVARWLQEQG